MPEGFRWVGYQQRWLADPSPQKLIVKSRRIGFSEVAIFKRVCRALGIDLIRGTHSKPANQNIISASHGQAKELLARAVKYLELFGHGVTGGIMQGKPGAEIIRLRNGVTMRALAANPMTVRGYEGDLLLDEFGSMPHAAEIWAAAQPTAKPTLGRPEGYEIEVVGTPLGDSNLFYEFARGDAKDAFSQHTVDVNQAAADGFPLTIKRGLKYEPATVDDLRKEMGDPDRFAQEYECSFAASSMMYITEKLYEQCLYDRADLAHLPIGSVALAPRLFGGFDVARDKDASALALLQEFGTLLWQREPVEARRDVAWADQETWFDGAAKRSVKICIDSTGLGSQFSERAENRWPGRIEGVAFTASSKEELATGLKLGLSRHKLKLLAEDADLRRDVLSMRREVTKAGNIRFDAPQTKFGHADRAWALALAVHAAGGVAIHHGPPVIHTPSSAVERHEQPPHHEYARPKRGGWR